METRREILRKILMGWGLIPLRPVALLSATTSRKKMAGEQLRTLYRSVNGTPRENLAKVFDLMGGVGKFVGQDDLVVIKPNAQWWNQGAPNLSALKMLVELIMERPGGFRGEVVLAENCHRGPSPWTSVDSGWKHEFDRNSDLPGIGNLGAFADFLKKRYGERFTVCHWLDVKHGARRVYGPGDGNGYVYCDGTGGIHLIACDNGRIGEKRRATIMTYPIFSTDKGTIVDFMHGIWGKGSYTGQLLRFINFAALNHHSVYCGVTSSLKNYLGVTDLSGGPDPVSGGRLAGGFCNFHSFPFDKWGPGPQPGMLGKEVGVFLETVRKADLNITSAEWVGLASRVDPPVARTRAILACTDPVALDYHAAKHLLYPNSRIAIHNPELQNGPLRQYLEECAKAGGGILDEGTVKVESYDHGKKRVQTEEEIAVNAEVEWGRVPETLLKYFVLRFLH
jgi:hypothetical protein